MRKGKVFVDDIFAGYIIEDNGYSFSYDSHYLVLGNALPVSLTLPLSNEAYNSDKIFPFFEGLIPEGYLLEVATTKLNINEEDKMGLLLSICKDVTGNVSVVEVLENE